MSGIDKDAFIRCHEAVHVVCSSAIPGIQGVFQNWHSPLQTTLGHCQTPMVCTTIGKPKPKPSQNPPSGKQAKYSCQTCINWGNALSAAEYTNAPQRITSSIAWNNVNPTALSQDPIEAAKAFVLRLPKGVPLPKTFDDFDTASLLMIMMKMGTFHQGNHNNYIAIKQVADIRNTLSHMKLNENLHLNQQTLETNLKTINHLVDTLHQVHPNVYTASVVSKTKTLLNDITTAPITAKMRDEALRPYSDEVKQVVCQTLEEQFKEHSQKMIKPLSEATDRLSEAIVKSLKMPIQEDMRTKQATEQEVPSTSTYRELQEPSKSEDTPEGSSTPAKVKKPNDSYLKEPLKGKDLRHIAEELGEPNRMRLFYKLGLKDQEIGDAKRGDDRDVVRQEQALLVFQYWRTKDPSKATLQAILTALSDAKNKLGKDNFHKMWIENAERKGTDMVTDDDMNDVIDKLSPANLQELYEYLDLELDEIDRVKVKQGGEAADIKLKAVRVFTYWKNKVGEDATKDGEGATKVQSPRHCKS